jgi:serine phosphatase RsbU (regulator of sigma subunit)
VRNPLPNPLGALDGPVLWRLVLLSWLLLLVGGVLARTGAAAAWFVAAPAMVAAWLLAVRFVLADSWGRWLWLVWLAAAGLIAARADGPGVVSGIGLSAAALTLRRYRPWRLVSARQRAVGFGLGVLAGGILLGAEPLWDDAPAGALVLRNLSGWAVGSLALFWGWSLFHLAVRMQLHFLRLRPKLAVSAFLVGFVPLVLVVLLAAMVLYTALGGARASRARATFESWREMTAQGADLAPALFDSVWTWPAAGAAEAPGVTATPVPAWAAGMAAGLSAGEGSLPAVVGADTTLWVAAEDQLLLVRWRGLRTDAVNARAWLVGDRALQSLSRQLRAGVMLRSLATDEDGAIQLDVGTMADFPVRRAMYRDVTADATFWQEWRYFGGSLLNVVHWRGERPETASLLVTLRTGWPDLHAEYFDGQDNLNFAVVIALGAVAFLFLVIEIFALFFGVRITEGIIAAVRTLGRGAKAVAGGDLDTVITVPNEDEFGDLAANFNEMIRAVKKGREDALARDRLTRELHNAREIQERLLPHAEPRVPGFEITGCSIPSREIGGDYFDFIIQADERVGLAIADVSGKGMPAALLMANLQASLHGQAMRRDGVAQVVARVNDQLTASTDPHMFATFFYGELDTRSGVLASTNAGHNPPLVVRADGSCGLLGRGGLLIGMLPDQVYEQEETTIGPGDVVVLYTDGITEAAAAGADPEDPETMFGDAALEDVVRRHAHLPAVGIKEAILAAVSRHTGGAEQSDDITLVVIRRQD